MAPAPEPATSWGVFGRHYVEMIVAMVVGMMVLGMVVRGLAVGFGFSAALEPVEVQASVMATTMTVPMVGLMIFRRHGWGAIAEMSAVMYLAFLILLVPYWAGSLSAGAVMAGGHMLMLPLMALAMLRRRAEYSMDHQRGPREPVTEPS